MIKKIKFLLSFLFILIVLCILLIIKSVKNNENKQIDKNIKITNEYLNQYRDNWEMIINHFLRGNISYNEMPLSISFKRKYKTINDIIDGECTGESMDSFFDIDSSNSINVMTICYKTGKGLEQIVYQLHYIINDNNELDDIEILNSRVFEDENGSYKQYDKYWLYDDCDFACGLLVRPWRNVPDYLYVNDNFLLKYPKYPEKGILLNETYMIEEDLWQDKENNRICYVIVMDLNYTKTYRIDVDIDEKGYVNDAIVSLIKTEVTKDPQYVNDVYREHY